MPRYRHEAEVVHLRRRARRWPCWAARSRAVAYDSSRDDVIAVGRDGGGCGRGRHAGRRGPRDVARELREPLDRPVVVMHGTWRFELTARRRGVQADVDGMVDEALDESRNGNIVSRAWRATSPAARRTPRCRLASRTRARRSRRLVERVVTRVDRPAQDAKVEFPTLDRVKEKPGLEGGRAPRCEQRVEQALSVPGVDRRVEAPVERLQPKVTRAELAKKLPGPARGRPQQLPAAPLQEAAPHEDLHGRGGRGRASTRRRACTTSRTRRWTPPGTCRRATGRATSPARSCPGGVPDNPLKARWLGIYDGAGIHGTDRPTRSAAQPHTAASAWRCPT